MLSKFRRWKEPSFIIDITQIIIAVAVAIVLALDITGIWSGLPWISNNLPSITFIAICLLIVSSFLERHLQINKFSSEVNYKLDELISRHSSGINLGDRSALTTPFEKRIQNAKNVYLLGITLSGILSHYFSYIVSRANSGCKFHFLILDPNYVYTTGETPRPWKGMTRRQLDTIQSVKQLAMLTEQSKNIQVGFVPSPPPFSLLLIDPKKPNGEIQVELHTYDVPESSQPHFILTSANDAYWYEFFMKQFEYGVKRSRPISIKDKKS